MEADHFEQTKEKVLVHIQNLFEEIEQELAMSHQEKYALLEDLFENASDIDELKVAFDQWHAEHADEIGFEHDAAEIWDYALSGDDDEDAEAAFEENEFEEEEEEDEAGLL